MKKWLYVASFLLIFVSLALFLRQRPLNANDYGVLPGNSSETNSKNLQALIDTVSKHGGVIYIPEGTYLFASNGSQTIGNHCIKMCSNVTLRGSGETTVLMPVGESLYGLDLFYFNHYLDCGQGEYLENCRFENFVIDASLTSCVAYTSAGKGFMLNLIRNCHWKNVTVKYTDATGFGVDCPLNCSMTDCRAIGCGKAASEDDPGASGFGIGYGYTEGESMILSGCTSIGNKKFGFFFEHQGRFNSQMYNLSNQGRFLAADCIAENNLYNFGGILAANVSYSRCTSMDPGRSEVFFDRCSNSYFNGIGDDDYAE